MTNKKTQTANIEEKSQTLFKKRIGEYSFETKINFDSKKEDAIYLEITLNEELQQILKSVSLNEFSENNPFLEQYNETTEKNEMFTTKRFKVRGFIYSALSRYKEFLFTEDLINKGKIKIPFYNIDLLDNFRSYFTSNIQTLLKALNKIDEQNQKIIFEPND